MTLSTQPPPGCLSPGVRAGGVWDVALLLLYSYLFIYKAQDSRHLERAPALQAPGRLRAAQLGGPRPPAPADPPRSSVLLQAQDDTGAGVDMRGYVPHQGLPDEGFVNQTFHTLNFNWCC